MRYFHGIPDGGNWEKFNFVDENNVFVGFDAGASCCERFGWFLADSPTNRYPDDYNTHQNELPDWAPWRFDPEFYEKLGFGPQDGEADFYPDDGGLAVFRLVHFETGEQKYLHLFNDHNGYYGHGFTMEIDGQMKREDVL